MTTPAPSPDVAPLLRAATAADAAAIADIGTRGFVARFGHLYSAENLDRFLRETHTPAKVSAELADPGLLCAVVEHDGRIVSYAKALIHSTLPRHTPAQRPFELKQLYTDPAVIGRGAGALLMEWTLAQARAHGADWLELSVYADNPQAQRFYGRYGLAKVADIEFWVGDHCDPECLFAVQL